MRQQPIEITPYEVALCGEIALVIAHRGAVRREGKRVVALGKNDNELCPRCETTRKVKVEGLGWACEECLQACVSVVVQSHELTLVQDRTKRAQLAHDLIIDLYREVEVDGLGMLTRAVHYLQRILEKERARAESPGPKEN